MIKSFKVFDRLLENKRLFEGEEYLINRIILTAGSRQTTTVMKYIKEVTGKQPPSTKNLGELAVFCIKNYKGFDNIDDNGPLKPYVDKIKKLIEDTVTQIEVERDWWADMGAGDDDQYAAYAVFGDPKSNEPKGLLPLFFGLFNYIVSLDAATLEGPLDWQAQLKMRNIVEEIKVYWDPEGWDAWSPLGGDSSAILDLNKKIKNTFGEYAEELGKLLAQKAIKYSTRTQSPTGTATTGAATTGAATTGAATVNQKDSTKTAQPAAKSRASSGTKTSGQTWNRAKKIKI